MVWHCFGPHFKVPMKGHEKTDHKSVKSRKGQTMKRQIMNIFMFTNNLLWLIYEPLVAKGLMTLRSGTLLTYRSFGPAFLKRIGPSGPLFLNKMTVR
jgi:hypothetical protein